LFDPKEELDKNHGKSYFQKIAGEVESPSAAGALMRSPFKFNQYGRSGMWVSELMPHLARHVDDIALIRSMYSTILTHEPAIYKIQSGRMLPGYAGVGSWVIYGLGTENQSLPAYVVLDDPLGLPVNGVENWQAGFLPPVYQGIRFRSTGSPVLNLKPEVEEPSEIVKLERDLLTRLDRIHLRQRPGNPALEARISKKTTKAIVDFKLIEDGDRVMVGVSGGKDSWALIQILDALQKRAPIDFSLVAVNVNSGYTNFRHDLVTTACAERGWEVRVEHTNIGAIMDDILDDGDTPCSLCARLRRGVAFERTEDAFYERVPQAKEAKERCL
jgi:hypothetical protein